MENKNLETFFNQKFNNLQVKPPDSVWNKISHKLFIYRFLRIFVLFSVVSAGIVSVFLLFFNSSNSNVSSPVSSNYVVSNFRSSDNSVSVSINSNTSTTNKNLLHKNIIKITKADSVVSHFEMITKTDTSLVYANADSTSFTNGFYLSSKFGCSPLTVILNSNAKNDKVLWTINNVKYSDSNSLSVTFTKPDVYQIGMTIQRNNKIKTFYDSVVVYEKPVVDFLVKTPIVSNQQIVFDNLSSDASEYKWYVNNKYVSSNSDLLYSFPKSGSFEVTLVAFNSFGCSDSVIKSISVIEPKVNIYFPTAFSPSIYGANGGYYENNPKDNSVFYPTVVGKEIKDYSLAIYNRDGTLLFESNDIAIGWDGYNKNVIVPIGVYIYIAKGIFTDGQQFYQNGSVTVIHE